MLGCVWFGGSAVLLFLCFLACRSLFGAYTSEPLLIISVNSGTVSNPSILEKHIIIEKQLFFWPKPSAK